MKILELLEFIQERGIFKISDIDTSQLTEQEVEIVKKELTKNLINFRQAYFKSILDNSKSFSKDFYNVYLRSIYESDDNDNDDNPPLRIEIVE